jgi:ABC-2 type transport system ATP-binding protein
LIEVENVTKRYGSRLAVDRLSFTVNRGEVLGFLGPNGAGKTTTMNILTGYISASSGRVRVNGLDILEAPSEVKRTIGYLPETPPLYPEMTVREYLNFVAELKKVSRADRFRNLERLVDLVRLQEVWPRLIKNLSKGYKQRVGLAQALIGAPEVLILDEPTVGLDPKQIIEIRNLIRDLGKEHTILLSSHILSEVSMVCERVLIINRGRIVAGDTPENLTRSLATGSKLALRIAGPPESVADLLRRIPGVKSLEAQGVREPGTIDLLVEAESEADIRRAVFAALSQAGYPLLMMRAVDLSLEEVFLQVTGDSAPPAGQPSPEREVS